MHLSDLLAQQICRIWQRIGLTIYVSNRVARPTSITNSVYLLAIVAIPTHRSCPLLICSSLLLMCTTGLLCGGKGCQHYTFISKVVCCCRYTQAARCTWGTCMCSIELYSCLFCINDLYDIGYLL